MMTKKSKNVIFYLILDDKLLLPENYEKMMNILLSNINVDKCETVSTIGRKSYSSKKFSAKNLFEEIIEDYCIKKEICKNEFVLIGYKNIEVATGIDDENLSKKTYSYEVHCRFYSNDDESGTKNDNIEFIFKDVTLTKFIEEKTAEIKLKSLVLSKIVHEFKNPLICIIELIDQISDLIDDGKLFYKSSNLEKLITKTTKESNHEIFNNLPLIKSLSNYLLVMVKDLDFFSQNQMGKTSNLELEECNLLEILEFCTQISKGLIKKSLKDKLVEYKTELAINVPQNIVTDETKLKQILINLQSNAVKFIKQGYIKLGITISEENENFLSFEVEDTGPGMSEENQVNLFKPFKKSKEKANIQGAGLGLSICRDLIAQIGGSLNFKSELGKGTSFYFSIPYKANLIKKNPIPKNPSNKEIIIKLEDLKNKSVFSSNRSLNETLVFNPMTLNKNLLQDEAMEVFYMAGVNDNINSNRRSSVFKNNNPSNNNAYSSINSIAALKRNSKFSKHSDEIIVTTNSPIKVVKKSSHSKKSNNNNEESVVESDISDSDALSNISENMSENRIELRDYPTSCQYKILLADDEYLARQSTIRNLKKSAMQYNVELNIVEYEDGSQLLNHIYNSQMNSEKIHGIITDDNMKVVKGTDFILIVNKYYGIDKRIPIFLLSAFDDIRIINNSDMFEKIFSKPLRLGSADEFIKKIIDINT